MGEIANHVAVMNLFREKDGSYRITVQSAAPDELLILSESRGAAKPPIALLVDPICEAAIQFREDWKP